MGKIGRKIPLFMGAAIRFPKLSRPIELGRENAFFQFRRAFVDQGGCPTKVRIS
jgi:hypothetical protein